MNKEEVKRPGLYHPLFRVLNKERVMRPGVYHPLFRVVKKEKVKRPGVNHNALTDEDIARAVKFIHYFLS